MPKVLCTFSGRFGDILWSLPTVKALAERYGHRIDMGIMPHYESLLPLIKYQDFIDDTFVISDWKLTGSPHGDQPWEAPAVPGKNYDVVWHLTYRFHPNEHLAVAIWRNVGPMVVLGIPPFIRTPEAVGLYGHVAYAFNPDFQQLKYEFVKRIRENFPGVEFIDVRSLPWLKAAEVINRAQCFIGCRSSNYVLAHLLGKRVLVFEPHPARRPDMFGSPWGNEVVPDVNDFAAFQRTLESWL